MIDVNKKILKLTDDGIQVHNSILWLDSKKNGKLSFISSALECPKKIVPQIIATEATLKISRHLGRCTKALVCQYNRPFSLGKSSLELLPSGTLLGGSSLLLEHEKKSFLYAPQLTLYKSELDRETQLREADILIIKASHPIHSRSVISHKKEFENLGNIALTCLQKGITPIFLCPLLPTAPELTLSFSKMGIPLSVHRDIYKINKIYESYGARLGDYNLIFSPKSQKNRAILLPRNYHFKKNPANDNKYDVFIINSSLEFSHFTPAQNSISLHYGCNKLELVRALKLIKPEKIYVFGPYAQKLTQSINEFASTVTTLFPNDHAPLIL